MRRYSARGIVFVIVIIIIVVYRRQLKHLLICSVILALLALVIIVISIFKLAKDKFYAAALSNYNGIESMQVRLKGRSIKD